MVRRHRSLVSRGVRSRYFRSEDGHPSPSPERKCMNYGTERALIIRETFRETAAPGTLGAIAAIEIPRQCGLDLVWLLPALRSQSP
jgi:hypothetical protein